MQWQLVAGTLMTANKATAEIQQQWPCRRRLHLMARRASRLLAADVEHTSFQPASKMPRAEKDARATIIARCARVFSHDAAGM